MVGKGSQQVQLTFTVEGSKVGRNAGEFESEPSCPITEKTQPFKFGRLHDAIVTRAYPLDDGRIHLFT